MYPDCPLPAIDVNVPCESNVYSHFTYIAQKFYKGWMGSQTQGEMPPVKTNKYIYDAFQKLKL